jgi:ligand-binding sensor domain-containing protein
MSVYEITADPQGHLWLGTENGIMEYNLESWTDLPISAPYVTESKSSIEKAPIKRQVIGLSVNHLKHALMAVYDSLSGQQLLMRFNGKTYVDLIKPFKATSIMEDLDANIWMNNGGYRIEGGKLVSTVKLPAGIVSCSIQDSRGDVWIGTDVAGVYRYDGKDLHHFGADHGFDGIRVTCLHEDKNGRVWMGTEAESNKIQGVSYFESGAMHHLQDAEACPVKSVNTIASDKKGHVWFAGENGALYTFNGRTFTTINTQKLMADF